jgi:hypothetical protein
MDSSPTLTQAEYETRKSCLEDLKHLQTEQYHEILRIIKRNNVEFSENSNGIFFDMVTISEKTFQDIKSFMKLCSTQESSQNDRIKEMESLRSEPTAT